LGLDELSGKAGLAPSAGIELLIVINADFDRWHHQLLV
jgi:hypothetical protein